MKIWETREDSLRYLEKEQPDQLDILSQMFDLVDSCVDIYEHLAGTNTYARISGLTLLKAKNLAIGAYSLILDGLAQEAGALLRPFIEYCELLTYFRKFPKMTERAAENNLPRAGERAKAIGGIYKEFREHLNAHASHSSYSNYSLAHLFDLHNRRFRKIQKAVPQVLDRNIRDFAVQIYLFMSEGVKSLEILEIDEFASIAKRTDDIKIKLISIFDLEKS